MGDKLSGQKNISLTSLLLELPRNFKKLLQVTFDLVALSVLYVSAFQLSGNNFTDDLDFLLGLVFVSLSLVGSIFFGVYGAIIRFSGIQLLESITASQLLSVGSVVALTKIVNSDLDLTFFLLLFLLSVFCLGGVRLITRELIFLNRPLGQKILIYGAGQAGRQLLTAVRQDPKYDVVGVITDQIHSVGTRLHGIKVYASTEVQRVIHDKNVAMVVLAIPHVGHEELKQVLDNLEPMSVIVKKLPEITNLLESSDYYENFEDIQFEELLGRDRVTPDEKLIAETINDKVVLVSGAGGSIGSELCRQIVTRAPRRLIMIELSELALYQIQQELEDDWGGMIVAVLGSVADSELVRSSILDYEVDTVFHAAAYKHVPLVEENPFSAITNNFFGTKSILEASIDCGVSSFTLVSTDKAVRPTNVMGASKRLAEILCQQASSIAVSGPKIAIVRFGNVIGSSGSAIPKFRAQINAGGPVTVTHPEINRYFMVISEAVELVMQASSLSSGGEVFVLDMGAPVKISDLVKKLIRFAGKLVSNRENPSIGAIEIRYTGLRPGEKLYEELLISGDAEDTVHPKIKKVIELFPDQQAFQVFAKKLKAVCESRDKIELRNLLLAEDIGYIYEPSNDYSNVVNYSNQQAQVISKHGDQLEHELPSNIEEVGNRSQSSKMSSLTRVNEKISPRFKLLSKLLHLYFFAVRPMTLGVRVILRNEDEEILFVKHTYTPGWYLPGGGVEVGEDVRSAAKRELLEEVGIKKLSKLRLKNVLYNNKISKRDHVVVFEAEVFKEEFQFKKNFEITELKFFKQKNLPNDIDVLSLLSLS